MGDDAELTCYVDNPQDYFVSWVKLNRDNPTDQTILALGTKLAIKDPRFLVTATHDSFTLQVNQNELLVF